MRAERGEVCAIEGAHRCVRLSLYLRQRIEPTRQPRWSDGERTNHEQYQPAMEGPHTPSARSVTAQSCCPPRPTASPERLPTREIAFGENDALVVKVSQGVCR